MQKKLCLGLGVVLLGFAALLFIAGNTTSDPAYRAVQNDEASLIIGGGGVSKYSWKACNSGGDVNGCTVTTAGYKRVDGTGQKPAGTATFCGGTCGSVYSSYQTIE